MKPFRTAVALFALLAATGCDPTYSVSGTVVEPSGAAVIGATVTKACPSGGTEVETTTGSGEFAFGGVGGSFEAPKCSLRIEKAGFKTQTVRTTDVCYRGTKEGNAGKPCGPGEGKITLLP